jgi:hypothetical protein
MSENMNLIIWFVPLLLNAGIAFPSFGIKIVVTDLMCHINFYHYVIEILVRKSVHSSHLSSHYRSLSAFSVHGCKHLYSKNHQRNYVLSMKSPTCAGCEGSDCIVDLTDINPWSDE